MKREQIAEIVQGIPHTTQERGQRIYDFILKHKLKNCLELGFAHGVGTVWIAGALQEIGGRVIAVDNLSAQKRLPSARTLVDKAGLAQYVDLHFDSISYTWHLQRNLEKYSADQFDFIFLDGAHTWDVDALAFFVCERVLKPGGWILFDDLNWTYAASPSLRNAPWVQALTDEQQQTQQVRKIWEKLVLTHPAFGNFREENGWGWAQKSLFANAPRALKLAAEWRPSLKKALKKVGLHR